MGIHRGPNTVKDGLVFGYDTGYGVADNSTATRFYPGKAVDNEFYNSGPDGTILDYVGYGGTGTARSGVLDALGTTDNIVYLKTGKLRFGPTGGDDIGTLYNGNTYTFSIYMRHVPGYTQMSGGEFDIVDQSSGGKNYSGTLSSNMTYEWKRFSVTSTHTNSSNYHFIDVGTYQGTGVFEWCCPQIELGTIASPFTSTERSDTASLIDLKKTANIDVSNVSFDSTGQPEFDGTSDRIVATPSSAITFSDQLTFDVWIYPMDYTASGGNRQYLIDPRGNGNTSGMSAYFLFDYMSSPDTVRITTGNSNVEVLSSNFSMPLNTWHNIVATRNGNSWVIYHNGISISTGTTNTTSLTLNNAFRIGTYANGSSGQYFFEGKMAVAKMYNQGLSATQVLQNYNAYKNRFDI